MKKTDCTITELGVGEVAVYDFGTVKLHAYKTNDPINDEVFVVEKDGSGFVIEYPCFFSNVKELEDYLSDQQISIQGVFAAYHMAGGTFLPQVPAYATQSAITYGQQGEGQALIGNFANAFGESFDASTPQEFVVIEGGAMTLAGIDVEIAPNADAFDICIPEINCVYTHMLGNDCHSIVAGEGHASAIVAQLESYKQQGVDLVLTSHYTPEDLKDAQTKIDYLQDLKAVAAASANAEEFKAAMLQQYPQYSGENYLDMTAGFFFGQ